MTGWTRKLSLLAASLGMVGCHIEPLYREHRAATLREAGSFHFAVVAVAPWESSVQQLQPNFELTESEALNSVLATTRTIEESVLRTTRAGLQAGGQTTPVGSGETKDQGSDSSGDDFDDYDDGDASEGAPGDAHSGPSEAPLDALALKELLSLNQHPLDHVNRDSQGTDPLTRYWAAAALYQEVRLLSQSLQHALQRRGYRPFIVRLKLNLLPNARNEPYDALCTLSFFNQDGSETAGARLPQVVPVLVTDDLERTKHSRIVDNTQELALALRYLAPLISSDVSVSEVLTKSQSVTGHDTNSLFTVTRITDNSLGVRLGAVQQAESNFAMIAQNHTLTALLLVPEGQSPQVTVLGDARFIDAETGVELEGPESDLLHGQVTKLLTTRAMGQSSSKQRQQILDAVKWNDWQQFYAGLSAIAPEKVQARQAAELWHGVSMLNSRACSSATSFDLPPSLSLRPTIQGQFSPQLALATDDGSHTEIDFQADGLSFDSTAEVSLVVPTTSGDFTLRPKQLSIDPSHGHIKLRFDSLSAWGLAPAGVLDLNMRIADESTKIICQYRSPDGLVVGLNSGAGESLAANPER